ncbi:MAG: alpha-glucan family phosphorylase [Dehalococcoidia bacterium]
MPGTRDIERVVTTLAGHLPPQLRGLASLAYNYWWSWAPGGESLFADIHEHRWARCGQNPVRLLQEVAPARLAALAADDAFVGRVERLSEQLDAELARPSAGLLDPDRPVLFMCAEFGVHGTLPIYAGGLGALAGDLLKEASDRAQPLVGIGLLYSQGSFHQRLDVDGWQHEYWIDTDAARIPAVEVRDHNGQPLRLSLPLRSRAVTFGVWRVNVGRVPLYLLDTNLRENLATDRWITSRLYIGDRETRFCQYALLGMGGLRAIRAMGIDPGLIHLNEGHAALASFDLIGTGLRDGLDFGAAVERARSRTVFTTHTPVAAGHDTYPVEQILSVAGDLLKENGLTGEPWAELGRDQPGEGSPGFAITACALRLSTAANGVSRRHGDVARRMWNGVWPGRAPVDVPISHVTNGVHLPTWMAPQMQALFDRYFVRGWRDHLADPGTWTAVERIPDAELWSARETLRGEFVQFVREQSARDRLARGRDADYAEAAARSWDSGRLTIGFARRIATYKRLYLLTLDADRGARLLSGDRAVQLGIAGKAHPDDVEAKRTIARLFALDEVAGVGDHVVFLDDYDLAMAARFVRGCDLWVNLPRPPQEASGTSGMKSTLNGGLQLSVLDGWWDEAFDGANGWAIASDPALDDATMDARDADRLHDLIEQRVVPLFYDRDESGVPRGWVRVMKNALISLGPLVNAGRMLDQYIARAAAIVT